MYTKDELAKLPIPELMEIANELGVKVSQDDELETVIYAILDKAAEDSAAGKPAPKRKRTRIAKDTSKAPILMSPSTSNHCPALLIFSRSMSAVIIGRTTRSLMPWSKNNLTLSSC